MSEEDQGKGTDRRSDGGRGKDKYKSKYSVRHQVLGKTEELEENIYKIGTNDQADLFIRTTEAIAEYVGKEYGYELRILVKHRKEPSFTKPAYPTDKAAVITRAAAKEAQAPAETSERESALMAEYKAELGIYHTKLEKYNENKAKVFVIILGQCSIGVLNWLEQGRGLDKLEVDRNVIGLLKLLEEMAFSNGGDQDPFLTAVLSLRRLASIQQGSKEHNAKYYKRVKTAADVLVGQWGDFFPSKLIKDGMTQAQAQDRLIARIFLIGADKGRFGPLLEDLNNAYVGGSDRYPKTLEETQRLLSKYQGPRNPNRLDGNEDRRGRSLAQSGNATPRNRTPSRSSSPESATGENNKSKKTDKKPGGKAKKRGTSPDVTWASRN
jgi:hypothetical protein